MCPRFAAGKMRKVGFVNWFAKALDSRSANTSSFFPYSSTLALKSVMFNPNLSLGLI
jgi:hypothetical protein